MSNNKKITELPKWLMNFPFPPDKKEPCFLTEGRKTVSIYGSGREKIAAPVDCSTDQIIFNAWELSPGQTFQPPDIHAGDEVYYVLAGVITVVNPETGQAVEAEEGECVLIPRKTWHCSYNFTDKKVEILSPAEGQLWDEEDMKQVSDFKLKILHYKGSNNESIKDIVGVWPPKKDNISIAEEKRIVRIPRSEALNIVHGVKNETKFTFFVSNERIHVGKFVICPGKYTDPEVHKGDEALWVLKGTLEIAILDENITEDTVVKTGFMIGERERFFIPEGCKHQYFNLKSGMCEVVFMVAPTL